MRYSHGWRRWFLILAVVLAAATLHGCGWFDDDDDGGGGAGGGAQTVTVTGQVSGSGGLSDVTVSAAAVSTTTDDDGLYLLAGVQVPADDRLLLTYEKEGYATYQRSIVVGDADSYAVSASLKLYDINEQAVDPSVATTLEAKDAGQNVLVGLDLPANSLQGAAAGNVKVSVAAGDPSTATGRATFPGDYLAASSSGGSPDTPLESVSFAEITIVDAAGKELTTLATPAQLTLRLPDEYQTGGGRAGTYVAGDPAKGMIPWWSYDEAQGTWIREDADPATPAIDDAEVQEIGGALYGVAKVSHFTWWNIDQPMSTHACLCAAVVDKEGAPMAGVQLVAEGVTYDGRSRPAITDSYGLACVNVKKSGSATDRERVRLRVEAGGVDFPYDVTDAAEGEVDTDALYTPIDQGSTLDGIQPGECTQLANAIAVAFDGRVEGAVTHEGSGAPAAEFTLYSDFGGTATTDADGHYGMDVPRNVDLLLFATGLASQQVRVTDAATPTVVDFVIPNQVPEIVSLTRAPDTTPLDTGAFATFTAVASDPDGDSITYTWSATAGTPTSGSGATFAWTAPATPQTATVTVTVADGRGGESHRDLAVVVGGAIGGSSLRVTVRDTPKSNQPVAGVHVILYNADNKTVDTANHKTTDPQGVADFGNIGRTRATLGIAYEEGSGAQASRFIDLFVDVLAGEIVYYVDDNRADPECTTSPTVTINLIPATDWGRIEPFDWPVVPATVPVCSGDLQEDDGLLSILALTGDLFSGVISYGFLLDLQVTDGATYTVETTRTPISVSWSTDPAIPLNSLIVGGIRQGVEYNNLASDFSGAATGVVEVPTDFPVDRHWVEGVVGNAWGATMRVSRKQYTPLPTTVTLPVPDYDISSLTYDAATHTFAWTVGGTTPRDVVVLAGSSHPAGSPAAEWSVAMAGGATGFQLPDLPSPIDTWVDLTAFDGEVNTASFVVVDWDNVADFDAAWTLLNAGVDLDGQATVFFSGSRVVLSGSGPATASVRTSTAVVAKPRPDPLAVFKGLVRR